jgi:hypothetical protein
LRAKRSNLHGTLKDFGDCFVAPLLAMTDVASTLQQPWGGLFPYCMLRTFVLK